MSLEQDLKEIQDLQDGGLLLIKNIIADNQRQNEQMKINTEEVKRIKKVLQGLLGE